MKFVDVLSKAGLALHSVEVTVGGAILTIAGIIAQPAFSNVVPQIFTNKQVAMDVSLSCIVAGAVLGVLGKAPQADAAAKAAALADAALVAKAVITATKKP